MPWGEGNGLRAKYKYLPVNYSSLPENYCRNPGSPLPGTWKYEYVGNGHKEWALFVGGQLASGPWCYTGFSNVRWESCDIDIKEECKDFIQTKQMWEPNRGHRAVTVEAFCKGVEGMPGEFDERWDLE